MRYNRLVCGNFKIELFIAAKLRFELAQNKGFWNRLAMGTFN